MSKKSRRHNKELARPAIEELEPRILYSADLLPVDAAVPAALHESLPESAPADTSAVQGAYPITAEASNTSTASLGNILIVDESSQQRHELVIIDSSVPDYQTLVDGIRQRQAEDTQLDIILLDSETASIQQLSNLLAQYNDLSAVHLISHGSDGQIQLGESIIDARTLADNQKIFTAWGDAFSTDGDFLIYGCNLAATDDGKALIDTLAELTGADVAASDDLTGDAAQGGDWDLEYRQGAIESAVVFSDALGLNWNQTLDLSTGLVGHWTGDVDASDSSSNAANGAFVGNAAVDTNTSTNQLGEGKFSFDGTGDYVNLNAAASNIKNLSEGSVSVWVNTTDNSNSPHAIFSLSDKSDSNSYSSVGIYQGNVFFDIAEKGNYAIWLDTTVNVADGNWHHIAVTVDAGGNEIYVDGTQLTGGQLSYSHGNTATTSFFNTVNGVDTVEIGGVTRGNNFEWDFNGLVDDLRVYNRGLNATEISQLYNFQKAPTNILLTQTTQVAITNAGFEAQGLSDSSIATSVTGWTDSGDSGVWNPDTAGYTNEAPEGLNVAYVSATTGGQTLSQTLTETFESNRSYSLSAWVGDEIGGGDTASWEMRLYAGTQLLGTVSNTDFNPADDEFIKATLHLDADTLSAFSANYGDALKIEFYNDDSTGSTDVHIDDVQLEYTYLNVADQAANGTPVADVASVVDPNSGDTFTYSLTDDAGGRFAIDSATGIVTVANGALLSYDSNSSHNITIRATDAASLTYDETFTIQVRPPLNNAPGSTSTNEDTALVFNSANGNLVKLQSDNPAATPIDVTLSITNGSLTLSQTTGLTFITGDGTADASMRIRGTLVNINAALDGMSYTPTDNYNGAASLSITSYDDARLLGNYSFDNTGNLGADTGPGTADNGIVTGATSLSDATRGTVINLSATGDEVRVSSLYGQPTDVTLAAWVNFDASATTPGEVISMGDAVALRVDEYGGKGVTAFYYDGTNWQEFTSNIAVKDTGWRHVAFTFDDTNNVQKLYIDGVEYASGAVTGSISYTSPAIAGGTLSNTTIGHHADPDEPGFTFKGQIDDARIYDTALSLTEIQQLMAAPMDSASDSVAITVNAVNDAPSLSAVSQDPTYTENGSAVAIYTSAVFNTHDLGEFQAIEEIKFTVTNVTDGADEQIVMDGSTYSLTDLTSGTTATNGYGYSVSLSGTTATVTLASNGASSLAYILTYQNTSEAPSTANRVFTITSIKDNGGTANGGVDTANPNLVSTVTVVAVNDAPVANSDPVDFYTDVTALNPLGYWRLGETSGTAATDTSSTANHGTYNGGTLAQAGALASDSDTSVHFNGTSDYVEIAHDPAYLVDQGTVLAWFKVDALGNKQTILSKDSGYFDTGGHMNIEIQSDGTLSVRQQSVDADYYATSTQTVTAGQWHLLGYSFGSDGMAVYLDGEQVAFNSYNGGLGTSSGGTGNFEPMVIGASTRGSGDLVATPLQRYFAGDIDEVAILGTQLSGSDIKALYGAGSQDYTIAEDGSLVVSAASGVLINDYDADGDALTVNTTPVTNVSNGSLTLNSDGSFTYTPSADFNSTDSFTYEISDGNGGTAQATATISINAVNDAPVNTVPASIAVVEDVASALTGISIADVDAGSASMLVTLSVPSGTLAATSGSGVTVGGTTSDLTLSGTVADINNFIAASNVIYTTATNANGSVTLTVLTSDQGNTGSGGTLTDSDSVTLNITAVNDEESLDTNAGLAVNEGASQTIDSAKLSTSDIDNTPDQVIYNVTTLPSNGQLELSTNSGVAISSFSQEDINNNRLIYVHNGSETTTDSFIFSVDDGSGTASNGTFSIAITLVNENAPVITAAQSFSVSELATNSTSLGHVVATDVDTATTLSAWTITAGNADGIFAIDAATGELTITDNTNLDFDTTPSYTLSLTVSDGTHTSAVETVTVNVTDVATAITAAQSFTIAENVGNTDPVGTVATTGDTPKTFTITAGNVGGAFTIDNAGNITVADSSAIDYETLTSYTLTIQASDGTTAVSEAVGVTITDINENTVGPLSDTDVALDAVAEDALVGATVGITATATDPDGTDTVSYSLSDDAGGLFTIDNVTGVVTVAAALDAETATSHSITVLATSTDASTSSQSYTITINDVDEFDVGAISDVDAAANTVAENAGIGDTVGITASASDADVDDNITYSLSDDAGGLFTIDSATGVVTVASALDYETATSHNSTVLATSDDTSTSSQIFTITVSDVNDNAPVITAAQSFSVSELAANSTSLGNVVATDVDTATTLSAWTITAGNADGIFTIDAATGELTITDNTNLDFDTTPSYTLSLTVSDGTHTSAVETVTINVTDVATAITAAQSLTIAENATNGAAVGSVVTTGDAPKTFAITAGNVGGAFAIDNSGNITVADSSAIDYETLTSYTLTIQASDGTTAVSEAVGVTITDINENTVGALSDTDVALDAVAEDALVGATVGITATATDPDGTDTVSYSLSDDAGGLFTIDNVTGVVTVAAALDAETATSHSITVLATSTDTSTASQSYTITVTDVDEFDVGAVADTDGAANTVAENAGIGDTVGITASASDADVDDNITYSLSDDAGGLFTIDSATGVVTVASALDYETATSHNITVLATSDDTSTSSQIFTITVSDVNDNAPVITAAQSFSVSELASNGVSLGTVAATDVDTATTLSAWTITAGNADGIFAIDGATGELTITDNTNLDFDTTPSYTLSLTVSDGTHTSAVETVTVNVTDENDNAPVVSAAQQFSVNESAASGTVVGSISASDVDTGTLLSDWRIVSGNSDGIFSIDAATGEITVTDPTALDFETTNRYDLGITVSDGVNTSASETVAIFVTNTNEVPLAVADSLVTDEDVAVATQNVLSNDDVGDAPISVVSFNAVSDQGGDVIYHGDGTFTYTPPLDFNGVDGFAYTIADASGDVSTTTVSVLVNAVNDAPVTGADHYTVNEDELLSVDATHGLLSNDSDVDADTLTAVLVGNPASGTVTLNPDGSFTYQASPDFNGTDQFIVEIRDGQGGVVQMPVVLEIQPVNDAPAALASQVIFPEDNEYVLQVNDFGFTDIDGDLISGITIDQLPAHGLLTLNGNSIAAGTTIEIAEIAAGHLSFMPEKDAFGENYDQLVFKVFDGELFSEAAATLTLNVTAVDDAPVIKTPGRQVASTDAPITFSSETSNSFNLDDLDSAQKIQTIVVEVTEGELIIPVTASSGQIEGNRTQRLEISGNIEQLNQALDGLVYQPRAGFVGDVELTMVAGDHGEVTEKITLTFAAPVIPTSLDTLSPPASNITDDSGSQDTDKELTADAPAQPALNSGMSAPELAPIGKPKTLDIDISAFTRRDAPDAIHDSGSELEATAINTVGGDLSFNVQVLKVLIDRLNELQAEDTEIDLATLDLSILKDGLDIESLDEAGLLDFNTGEIVLSGVTVGTILWVLRATGFLSSLLLSYPAWRNVDPLPVLSQVPEDEDLGEDSDESESKTKKKPVSTSF